MRTKATVALLLVVLAFYCVLVGVKGVALLRQGGVVEVMLGLGLVVLPVLGLALVWREVQFGRRTAKLGERLAAEGGLPVDDLPRRPSGRVDRAAADVVFERYRAEAQAQPDSWRAWY